MTTLTIDTARFKEMASRMRECAAGKSTPIGSHQSALQLLAQTLFGKPYEEVKATLLDTTTVTVAPVLLLSYGGQHILAAHGRYMNATNPGTDLEIPFRVLEGEAHRFAQSLGAPVKEIQLPQALSDGYSDDEVVALAVRMGYHYAHPSIFECLSDMSGAFIDDLMFTEPMVSDAWDLLESTDDPDEALLWMPELRTVEGTYEHFFSFADLCDATTQDGITWRIKSGQQSHTIRFVY